MRAFLVYTVLRLGLLVAAFLVLWALRAPLGLAVIGAFVASALLSYLFLNKQRTVLAENLQERIERRIEKAQRNARPDQDALAEDAAVAAAETAERPER